MIRFFGLVLSVALLTPALAVNEPEEDTINLRVEGEICKENWEQSIPDFFDDQDDQYQKALIEQTRMDEKAVARLAASDRAEDHLYRASLFRSEPLLAAKSLNMAFEIDPSSLLVLRHLGEYCLNNEAPFCAKVTERLAGSKDSSANELLLAAALFHHSGRVGIEALYRKSVHRGFSNTHGQSLAYGWRITQDVLEMDDPDLELFELDQFGDSDHTILAFAIAMGSSSIRYFTELSSVCNPKSKDRPYTIEDSVCIDLVRNLAHKGSTIIDQAIGATLLLNLAEKSGNSAQLAEAQAAKKAIDDLRVRSVGLSCYDDGRFQKQYFGTLEYLESSIRNGEVYAISSLIEKIESGELQ